MRNSISTLFAVLFAVFLAVGVAGAQSQIAINQNVDVQASTAWQIADFTSPDFKNNNYRGLHLTLDITDTAGTASVTLTIQGKDETSGKYYTLLGGAAKTAPGTTDMIIYPGCIAAANTVANMPLPKLWRAFVDIPAGDSVKFTVGASLIE